MVSSLARDSSVRVIEGAGRSFNKQQQKHPKLGQKALAALDFIHVH